MGSDILSKVSLNTVKEIVGHLRTNYLGERGAFTEYGIEARLKSLLRKHKVDCFKVEVTREELGHLKAVVNFFAAKLVIRVFYNEYNALGISAALVRTEIL